MKLDLKSLSEEVRNSLHMICDAKHFRELLSFAQEGSKLYIVGGFVRDCINSYVNGANIKPNDIDIVISGRLDSKIWNRISGRLGRTALGGYRWFPDKCPLYIDFWPLEDTFFLADNGARPTIKNYLFGSDFNVNKIAFDINKKMLVDYGGIAGIINKNIDYCPGWNEDKRLYLHAVKLFMLSAKSGFSISKKSMEVMKKSMWRENMHKSREYYKLNLASAELLNTAFKMLSETYK